MNNKVPIECLEMCVVTHDSDSRSLINDDSILKYCNPFWDTIGRCRKAGPGIFLDISLITMISGLNFIRFGKILPFFLGLKYIFL